MSLEYSSKITVNWKVEGVKELLKKGEKAQLHHDSPSFDHGRWRIGFRLEPATSEEASLYLLPCCSPAEKQGFGERGCGSRGQIVATFQLLAADGSLVGSPHTLSETFALDSETGWGWSAFIKRETLQAAVTSEDMIIIRAEIEPSTPVKPLPPLPAEENSTLMYELFRKPAWANVAFLVQPLPSRQPCYLFASELVLRSRSSYFNDMLSSAFAEAAPIRLDLSTLPTRFKDALEGDEAEFYVFEEDFASGAYAHRLEQKRIGRFSRFATRLAALCISGPVLSAPVEVVPLTPLMAKVYVPPSASSGKVVSHVTVTGCSFATFGALLSFLHGGKVNFLPSTSQHLEAHEEGEKERYSAVTREHWQKHEQSTTQHPLACTPHALYRLADRYLLETLREVVKLELVDKLTVKTVAYEMFSALSIDYEDVQKGILPFLLENWKEVKETRAWKQAMDLLEAGQLPGGSAVLDRIHAGL